MPTQIQMLKAVILCQYLSNGYKPIQLFRYDPGEKYIYIWAGEAMEIQIFENGNWRFIDELT